MSNSNPNPRFRNLFRHNECVNAFLGTAGVVILLLIFVALMIRSTNQSVIHYTPADIVYGHTINAVHRMGAINPVQSSEIASQNPTMNPNIRFSETFYDFGPVSDQQALSRTFVIENNGQSPLIIQQAYTTCGCTIATISANEIPPGKVALMTLTFDPGFHDMRGTTVRRGVMIVTNDPDHPIMEIWIQATVRR